MNQQELHLFLEKLALGLHTKEEYAVFTLWVENCNKEEYQQMLIYWEELVNGQKTFDAISSKLIENINLGLDQIDAAAKESSIATIHPQPGNIKSLWIRVAAAASIILLLYTGGYYFLHKQPVKPQIAQNKVHDIAPGGNKAMLTLADGRQIILTDAPNGKIADQGETIINKTANGQIIYTTASKAPLRINWGYNTISTPKGGMYAVILPDGSKVLLNAASSLHYPTAFTGKERKVELTGEAYFEIIHNNAMPFRVTTASQVVEDIGTHFNINAYNDERVIKTTLLEGKVKVSIQKQQVILKPGQQSQTNLGLLHQNINVVNNADTEEVVAWKNGLFEFKNATIKQVMNNASRWYDINVFYGNKMPDTKITGRISRNVNLSGLIDLLQFEGVKFKIEGKNVTVLNK